MFRGVKQNPDKLYFLDKTTSNRFKKIDKRYKLTSDLGTIARYELVVDDSSVQLMTSLYLSGPFIPLMWVPTPTKKIGSFCSPHNECSKLITHQIAEKLKKIDSFNKRI